MEQPLEQPLQYGLRFGKYCPDEKGTCVDFYVYQNPRGEEYGYIFNFMTPVQNIVSLFKYENSLDKGYYLYVTRDSYATFLTRVVGTFTPWNDVVNALRGTNGVKTPQNIPGTWRWMTADEEKIFYEDPQLPKDSSHDAREAAARGLGDSGNLSESVHSGPDTACAPPSHDDTFLLGKYVKTDDNTSYDFSCKYSENYERYILVILGARLIDDEPNCEPISNIEDNTAWFNGIATGVKLDKDSFKNLKTTLENNTGIWKDSIFPGKWFTNEGYEEYKKKMSKRYSCVAARRMMTGSIGGSSRKSKRIHRKPTKRRRNRRGNRKTKKN